MLNKEKLERGKQKHTSQTGITLIALIITIIVMLILVGVSVTVALNGGLFTTAKNAVDETQAEKDREMGLSEGQIEIGGIVYNSYQDYLDKKPASQEPVLDVLSDYILGEKDETTGQRPGRELSEIVDLDKVGFIEESVPEELQDANLTLNTLAFVSTTEVLEKTDTEGNITYVTGLSIDYYFTYEETMYKFRCIGEGSVQMTLPEFGVKDLSYDTTSKVGRHVKYDGIDWIVLYDDTENGLQMISTDVIKDENDETIECHLGYLGEQDTTFAEDEVTEIDGVEGKSNLEKTMYSYSRALTRLNTTCEGLVTPKAGVIKGVRSVGSNPITPNEDNSKSFIGSKDTIVEYGTSTWFEDNLKLQLNKTEERTYYTIKGTNPAQEYILKDTDYNYEKDFDRMVALKINETTDEYWLASHLVLSSSNVFFSVRFVNKGFNTYQPLMYVETSKTGNDGFDYAVRPVVTLESGALDNLTGDGLTAETAYQLD